LIGATLLGRKIGAGVIRVLAAGRMTVSAETSSGATLQLHSPTEAMAQPSAGTMEPHASARGVTAGRTAGDGSSGLAGRHYCRCASIPINDDGHRFRDRLYRTRLYSSTALCPVDGLTARLRPLTKQRGARYRPCALSGPAPRVEVLADVLDPVARP
jgi:hypothetical protein